MKSGKRSSTVDGVADLTVQQLTVVPQVEVRMRPEAAQIAGVTPAQVRDSMATLLRGTKVGEIYDDQKIFDTVVWSVPAVRSDLFAIKRLPIDTGNGGYVPLEAVADVTLAPTPNEITREGGSRRIDVTTNVRDRDLGAVAQDIQTALGRRDVPGGLSRGGARANTRRARLRRTACWPSASFRCSASCWSCTSTSGRRGWSPWSR